MLSSNHGHATALLIYDSLGRRDLALRCGPTRGWEKFELIRAAACDTDVRVNFELWHPGEAWIDDVSMAILDSPSRRTPEMNSPADVR